MERLAANAGQDVGLANLRVGGKGQLKTYGVQRDGAVLHAVPGYFQRSPWIFPNVSLPILQNLKIPLRSDFIDRSNLV